MRNRSNRVTCRLVLAAVAALAAGQATASVRIVERFIAEERPVLFEPASVLEAVEVARWPLTTLADLEAWQRADVSVSEGPSGLVFRATGPRPRLERTVNLDAATVDALRLDGVSNPKWVAKVFWTHAGEKFAGERRAQCDQDASGHPIFSRQEIVLASQPQWSGRIARLRVPLDASSAHELSIGAVVAVKYRPASGRWEQATRSPWKVKLLGADVGDVRNALLAPLDHPIRRRVTPPVGAQLQFDYGVQGRVPGPLCFRVRATAGDGAPLELFARCLEPTQADRWVSATADLAALGGRPAELVFEISGDRGCAMPLWANPQIVAPVPTQPPNVVLISVDTLRRDRLGIYGYQRATSPHLDAWARAHAVIFDQAIAAAPWTIPSHVSMLTGLSPLRHGVNYVQAAPLEPLTAAEILRAAGYSTLAVTGGGYLAPWVGLHQGFDRYAYWRHRHGKPGESELASDVDLARQWLREAADRPVFLFFHTYEVHAPYVARAPFFARFNQSGLDLPPGGVGISSADLGADTRFVTTLAPIWGQPSKDRPQGDGALPAAALPLLDALYDSGVAYMDEQVGRLLDSLRELGLERRTLVIFTSDHGEALGERGLAGHAYLFDFNLRVPLLLALPNGAHAGTHVRAQVQSVDLLPTLLEAAGVPLPRPVDGHSALPLLATPTAAGAKAWSYAAQTNHGVALRLDGGVKYVFDNSAWSPVQGRDRLYRLDPKTGEEREEKDGVPQRNTLHQEVVRRYASDGPPALAVTVTNRLPIELRGRLAAKQLKAMQIKTLEPPPGTLRWAGRGIDFAVPPGQRLQLFLEGALADELRLSLDGDAPGGASRVRERVRLSDISGPRSLQLGSVEASSWTAAPLAAGASGVELAWRGRQHQPPSEAVALPDEVREQLRALGYDR
jgi:arylsulfatase A-like enzyme